MIVIDRTWDFIYNANGHVILMQSYNKIINQRNNTVPEMKIGHSIIIQGLYA